MPSSTYYEKFAWGALSGVCGGLAVYVSMRMRRLQPHLQPVARQAVAAASSAPPCPIPTRPSLSAGAQQAAAVLKLIVPPLDGTTYKGQGGRVGILGGSVDYTGAPFYAAMAALRVGAELCTIYTATEAASAIKSYSPELMVTPVYSHTTLSTGGTIAASTETDKMVKTVLSGAERLHVLVIGPGLGRDPQVLHAVGRIILRIRDTDLPLVIDADGIWLVTEHPEIIKGYPKAILTPNAREYQRLADKVLGDGNGSVEALSAALGGVTIVQKGAEDRISDGSKAAVCCTEEGAPRRCGGLGDFLCGTIGILSAWSEIATKKAADGWPVASTVDTAHAASVLVRRACKAAFLEQKRGMTAPDVLDHVSAAFDELCPWDAALASTPRGGGGGTGGGGDGGGAVAAAIASAAATPDDVASGAAPEGSGETRTPQCPFNFGSK